MWNLIHKYGATICSCDNVAWHPLLNVMFACPSGDVFIGSIDTIGEQKDAQYICNDWVDTSKPLELTTLYKFVQTML
jgi:hypothetical protein